MRCAQQTTQQAALVAFPTPQQRAMLVHDTISESAVQGGEEGAPHRIVHPAKCSHTWPRGCSASCRTVPRINLWRQWGLHTAMHADACFLLCQALLASPGDYAPGPWPSLWLAVTPVSARRVVNSPPYLHSLLPPAWGSGDVVLSWHTHFPATRLSVEVHCEGVRVG